MEERMSYREYIEWLTYFSGKGPTEGAAGVPAWQIQKEKMLRHIALTQGKRRGR